MKVWNKACNEGKRKKVSKEERTPAVVRNKD
jgi:hypothetical protein